jgi:hypothetical protein
MISRRLGLMNSGRNGVDGSGRSNVLSPDYGVISITVTALLAASDTYRVFPFDAIQH